MEFDLKGKDLPSAYRLLAGLVTPRPIALVTTVDTEGRINAAPFSFFNVFGTKPPIVGFAPGNKSPGIPKDTARNISLSHEFVVNLVDEDLAEAMNLTAAALPAGESELALANLTARASVNVSPPRIAEAPASLECRDWGTLAIGDNRLVIGIVERVHVRDGILDPESLAVSDDAYTPIGRMHGPTGYTRTRDRFHMTRPG